MTTRRPAGLDYVARVVHKVLYFSVPAFVRSSMHGHLSPGEVPQLCAVQQEDHCALSVPQEKAGFSLPRRTGQDSCSGM